MSHLLRGFNSNELVKYCPKEKNYIREKEQCHILELEAATVVGAVYLKK